MLEAENYRQKSHTRTIDKFSNNQSSAELEALTNSLRYTRQRGWRIRRPAAQNRLRELGQRARSACFAPEEAASEDRHEVRPEDRLAVPSQQPRRQCRALGSSSATDAQAAADGGLSGGGATPTTSPPDVLNNTLQLQPSTASRITIPQNRHSGRSAGSVT